LILIIYVSLLNNNLFKNMKKFVILLLFIENYHGSLKNGGSKHLSKSNRL